MAHDADRVSRVDPSMEDEGIPDHIGPLDEKAATGDAQYGAYPPGDRPRGTAEYGVTAAEQRHDEGLSDRLAREDPDEATGAAAGALGRVVEPESGVDEIDRTKEAVAHDEAGDTAGLTAEEAAMHETSGP